MSTTINNIGIEGQNNIPSGQSAQSPSTIQNLSASQGWKDNLSHEDIQFLRTVQTPGFSEDSQSVGSGLVTQGAVTNLCPDYLDYQHIPADILQRVQSRMIAGMPLIHVFNHMLHQCINFTTAGSRYDLTDIGASYMLADLFKNYLRYVPERRSWYRFNGQKWLPDNGFAMECCKILAKDLKVLLAAVKYNCREANKEQLNFFDRFVTKWQSRRGREAILKDAETVYPIKMSEFDANPYLLNCLNGTLDMQNWIFYPHRPDDLITKMANVICDPSAWCDRWVKHIDEVMMGDPDRSLFLQQALGYALTGTTNFECFFILFGPTTRNGKSLTLGTFATLLGDYACNAQPDTITQKQKFNGSAPSEDLARLAGARFINIAEPDKKMTLSTSLVKSLTGNDTITARRLHENSFEFKLSGKIFINTNHLPAVTDTTVFNSNRVKVIPFERHFEPHEQDKNLKAYLAEPQNLSGILNWCLVGLQNLQENGFIDCQSVQLAIEDYQQDSDKMSAFISDVLEESPGSEVLTETVYGVYKEWCDANGYKYGSHVTFKKDMLSRAQITRKRPAGQPGTNPRSMIIGFKLKQMRQPMSQLPPNYCVATDGNEV